MTPAELSEITQRADKLDKGKWKAEITYHEEPGYEQFIKRIEIVQKSTCIARMDWSNPPKEYAEFIAHARQDIPDLLAHISELTGKAGELEAIGEQMRWVPVIDCVYKNSPLPTMTIAVADYDAVCRERDELHQQLAECKTCNHVDWQRCCKAVHGTA
jgi:hypothetical protein